MSFWKSNNFRLDPWGLDYELPIALEQEESSSPTDVDTGIETTDWTVSPRLKESQELVLPNRLIFVDGRRRLDARFHNGEDNGGIFATIAVGAVEVNRLTQTATCLSPHVIKRVIAVSSQPKVSLAPEDTQIPCPLGNSTKLVYDTFLVKKEAENNDDGNDEAVHLITPLSLVQQEMRTEENKLAMQFVSNSTTLVIQDGNLFGKAGSTLGYVKTMQKRYLSGIYAELLLTLNYGERTPVFAILGKNHRVRRYSWYLRSGSPRILWQRFGYHALHGLVRLELNAATVSRSQAIEIAHQTTHLIPEYASHPNRDPRAPQNLTPISALEEELGRHMGDRTIISRRIQTFLASGGAPT